MQKNLTEDKEQVKGLVDALADIMEKVGGVSLTDSLHKYVSGKSTLDQLEYDIEEWLNNVFPSEDALRFKLGWITIQGNDYRVGLIHSLEDKDKYSFKDNKQDYQIVMNRSASVNYAYANTVFSFESPEARAKERKRIRDLQIINGARFLDV